MWSGVVPATVYWFFEVTLDLFFTLASWLDALWHCAYLYNIPLSILVCCWITDSSPPFNFVLQFLMIAYSDTALALTHTWTNFLRCLWWCCTFSICHYMTYTALNTEQLIFFNVSMWKQSNLMLVLKFNFCLFFISNLIKIDFFHLTKLVLLRCNYLFFSQNPKKTHFFSLFNLS